MMMNTTLEQLRGLRLHGMASGLQEQMAESSAEPRYTLVFLPGVSSFSVQ